ncbi:MAG: PCRF domain-containing protein, partial [Gammaproteobacteria bacterium]
MKDSLLKKLESLKERRVEIEALLADASVIANQKRFRELSREYAEISPVVACFNEYARTAQRIHSAQEMLKDPDKSLRELAAEELAEGEKQSGHLEAEMQKLLLPRDPADNSNIFLEIRAGTGGEEAALFAADLFRMYSRYAERRGW